MDHRIQINCQFLTIIALVSVLSTWHVIKRKFQKATALRRMRFLGGVDIPKVFLLLVNLYGFLHLYKRSKDLLLFNYQNGVHQLQYSLGLFDVLENLFIFRERLFLCTGLTLFPFGQELLQLNRVV